MSQAEPGNWDSLPRSGILARAESLAGRCVLALAAFALTAALFAAGAFEAFEDRLTELRAELLARQPSGEVVIAEIDARSLARLETWPWSRRYHADLVRRLDESGARLIAFDVDFSATSDPVSDRDFAEAISAAEPVILPIFQQRASDQSTSGAVITNGPAAPFKSAWVGGVNIFPDSDGLVREYAAATFINGNIQPSIAALVAQNSDLSDHRFQPDWSIDAARIPRISFVDVIEGRAPTHLIEGKSILVGATAIELGDRYTIPRHGIVPGVVIQALAAESLIQHRAIVRTAALPTLLGVGLIALLLCAARYRRFEIAFAATAGSCLIALFAVPIVIQAYWPVSIDTAPMIFAALICAFIRIGIEIRKRIEFRNLHDAETGLPNRLMLEECLNGTTASAIVAVASIDRFETIRDAIGIKGAAQVVRESALRLAEDGKRTLFRIAPDMLAWVQQQIPAQTAAAQIASFAMAFREPVRTSEGKVDVALTFGIDPGPDGAAVLRIERAIAAVGSARATENLCHWYEGANPAARRELSLMGELRQGLRRGEVSLAYQPKLRLRDGIVSSAEGLMRWHHPVDGLIPPDRFVPLAEATGVVRELTEFALASAMADCARWKARGIEMRPAINLSAGDVSNAEFVALVRRLLGEHGLQPSEIALEITESAIIRSPDTAIAVLTELRELGLRLSIDDYGTGQSTLTYLKQLPVHEIKIDKSFIRSLCQSPSDAIMVRSTIDMAHDLGLEVVAEGIEDAQTLDRLVEMNCDYIQGYFVGKPMAFDDLTNMVTTETAVRAVAG